MATFVQESIAELTYLIGLYGSVSVTFNGLAVPVPEDG